MWNLCGTHPLSPLLPPTFLLLSASPVSSVTSPIKIPSKRRRFTSRNPTYMLFTILTHLFSQISNFSPSHQKDPFPSSLLESQVLSSLSLIDYFLLNFKFFIHGFFFFACKYFSFINFCCVFFCVFSVCMVSYRIWCC